MYTRFIRFGFLLTLLLVLAACAETPQVTRTPIKLRLAEAADQAAVLDRLVRAYTADREWVSASTTSTSPQEAVAHVRGGQLDAVLLHDAPEQTAGVWISGLAHA